MSEQVGIFISYRRIDASRAGIMLVNFLARRSPDPDVFIDLKR